MIHTEASIEIKRTASHISMSVSMPFWTKESQEAHIAAVNIPLFGLKTFASANDDNDIHSSIEEAIRCFVISSEKFGQGIEKELEVIGWQAVDHSLEYLQENPVIEQIMNTGDPYVDRLELEAIGAC